ncbi:ATP-binding protein [Streptomyces sp. NPDC006703]|uniref:ATP-binding protein n=1 Tax=Streptomyces sp. NPDC006703 TaxID=3364759 RepID=UPI003690DD27
MSAIPVIPLGCLYRWTSCTPNPAAQARMKLRCALSQLGLPGELISDGVLAVSELVANASEHALGPYELRLRRMVGTLMCEVLDHDPRIPHLAEFPSATPFEAKPQSCGGGLDALLALLSERGRGLHIVHELTRGAWGFRTSGNGTKVVWIALPLRNAGPDSVCQGEQPRAASDLYDTDR